MQSYLKALGICESVSTDDAGPHPLGENPTLT